MNNIEKFVTMFCVLCGAYSVYEKCEANPGHECCGKVLNLILFSVIFMSHIFAVY